MKIIHDDDQDFKFNLVECGIKHDDGDFRFGGTVIVIGPDD